MIAAAVVLMMAATDGEALSDKDAQRLADVRCLIASAALAGSGSSPFQGAGAAASLYWLGRLGAFDEGALERQMTAEALKMTETDLRLELQRCGAELKLRGEAMERIGQKMQERAQRADTH